MCPRCIEVMISDEHILAPPREALVQPRTQGPAVSSVLSTGELRPVDPASALRPHVSPQTGCESGSLPYSGVTWTGPWSLRAWDSHCHHRSDLRAGKAKRHKESRGLSIRAAAPSRDDAALDPPPVHRSWARPRRPTRARC